MGRILLGVLFLTGVMLAYAPLGLDTSNRPLYYQGTVKIQLKESAVASKDFQVREHGQLYSKTGIPSLDKIGENIKASNTRITHIKAKNESLAKKLGLDRWITVTIPEDQDIMAAVEMYKADPNVDFAQPEYANYLMAIPNDTYFANNWGHNNTGQLPAYSTSTYSHSGSPVGTVGFDTNIITGWDGTQSYGNPDIVIAIMDTGVDYDHPDLAANYIGGWDAAMNDTNPDDNEGISNVSGHGTSCAGVAAGVINNGIGVSGVAGNCSIMAIKVLNSSGSLVGMADGAIYAGDNGADILSMSYGGDYQYGTDATADAAYSYAYNSGVTLLAATGNDNESHISYPANHPDIIGVGAAAPDNGRKNEYSIDGEYWWGSNWSTVAQDDRAAVDFIAPTIMPATDIVGSGGFDPGDYGLYFNGTSCATPYAAGFAALIKSHWPAYTPAEVRQVMIDTAMDIDDEESTAGWDGVTGYGLIDIDAALGWVPTAPPPVCVLSSPSNGSTIADAKPLFDWEDNTEASSYTILVDNTSNFSSPEINEVTTESEYTSVSNLAEGIYYWKVQATNIIGSSSYTTAWSTSISFPDINLPATTSATASLGGTVEDSFDIGNTGNYTLSYSMSNDYVGYATPPVSIHSNDFESGLIYTSSGTQPFTVVSGMTANCARVSAYTTQQQQSRTGILTSASFNGTGNTELNLEFDQIATLTNSSITVEYTDNGSTWYPLYTSSSSVTDHKTLPLPNISSTMQIKFSCVLKNASGSSWSIDNVAVGNNGAPHTWLTFDSPTSGTVSVSGTKTINMTYNAGTLAEGDYEANITVTSDDPDEPSKVVGVTFTVGGGVQPPAQPANVVTSISGTDLVIDWDVSANATSYDVYSSDDPYGTFSFEANVGTNQYAIPYTDAKKFYYIVSKSAAK
ncbi:MAG: S8 family serine peptidase [Candidatus Delongbacteria bacterium]|nr:S8 family serine peptidase [Candidatus Delongbacteria bacterium]